VKPIAAALLLLVTVTGVTAHLHEYHASIPKSMAACHGALGSVHFEGGQAMVFASPGVNESLNTGSAGGAQGITFINQRTHAQASFDVYPKRRIVEANHLKFKVPGKFVCILPD
jgi:hypothetical protein